MYRLVLHPRAINEAMASWKPIINALQEAEFLAAPWGGEKSRRFLAGGCFLDYITFMGCSPHIALEPPTDGSLNFCHIHLSEIYTHSRFRCASRNVFAHCPHCGKRLGQRETAIDKWRKDPASVMIHCEKCNVGVSLYQLGWRHTAGFARMFMDVYGIYPHEGIPADPLLGLLERPSGFAWDYFYSDG